MEKGISLERSKKFLGKGRDIFFQAHAAFLDRFGVFHSYISKMPRFVDNIGDILFIRGVPFNESIFCGMFR